MRIKNHEIRNFTEPYVIAEIGSNHNGDMELARQLIDSAKEVGADCVKFQSWSKDSIFSRQVYNDNYFLKDDYRNRTDYTLEEIVDAFSVSEEELIELKKYCDEVDIEFASTPFSPKEADFLVDVLDVAFIKIASMDINNYPFLDYVARKGKPIIMSTGLSTLAEVDKAVKTIYAAGNKELSLLHCVAIYPPDDHEVNLLNIKMLRDLYDVPVGFSDHTIGATACIGAAIHGACVLEKHFTLDNDMFGWDHKISADPHLMKTIIAEGKRAVKMNGSYNKQLVESEERQNAFKRSIVAGRDIEQGEIFSAENLDFKRPGTGLEPGFVEVILGRKATRDIAFDEQITMEDF